MMVDKQIHFHIVARYNRKIAFSKLIGEDVVYPRLTSFSFSKMLNEKLLEIKNNIIKNLVT